MWKNKSTNKNKLWKIVSIREDDIYKQNINMDGKNFNPQKKIICIFPEATGKWHKDVKQLL